MLNIIPFLILFNKFQQIPSDELVWTRLLSPKIVTAIIK